MKHHSISGLLSGNSYPGRGIIIGMSEDAEHILCAYFIMGRSENSRNRVFENRDNAVITRAFDESKVTDPSLILYTPILSFDSKLIITNGDQTDTIAAFLRQGKTFSQALNTREYEPDTPNYTPRISAMIEKTDAGFTYTMSILKRGASGTPERVYWTYIPKAGEGHFLHTYKHDGNPLPSFEGEPVKVALNGNLDDFSASIWDHLNEENKISLFTRSISLKTGEEVTWITNKHEIKQ